MEIYLYALALAIFWLQSLYWKLLLFSILFTFKACKWMIRQIPRRNKTNFDAIKTWLEFILFNFSPVALLTIWCIFLSPLQLLWSPVELYAHYNTTIRGSLTPAQIIYDPAASDPSLTLSGLVDLE